MTRRMTLAVALAATVASGALAVAQPQLPPQPAEQQPVQPPLPPPPPSPPPGTPPPPPPPPGTPSADVGVDLSVEVTISRYQGDELISSLPYVLAVTSHDGRRRLPMGAIPGTSSLRMDAEVPVLTMAQPGNPDGEPLPGLHGGPFTYRPVGTRIDCHTRSLGDGRYAINVVIEESSVYSDDDLTSMETFRAPGVPVFRSFESSNTLVLRDGQSRQYTAAADRVTGESIRVDVALTVLD